MPNPVLNTKGLRMPTARFVEADGKVTVVQLPGTRLQFGAVYYDEKIHKGKLICMCCDAPVHFRKTPPTIAADTLRGPRYHFASNRQSYHSDDCKVERLVPHERTGLVYDHSKPPVILIGTGELHEQFNGRARPFARRRYPHHKILKHPDLQDRETYSVRTIKDLQKVVGKNPSDRMKNATIVIGGDMIDMKDFFFRVNYKREDHRAFSKLQPQLLNLVGLLQEFGDNQHALVEFDLGKARYAQNKRVAIEMRPMPLAGKDEKGYKREIVLRLIVAQSDQEQIIADKLAGERNVLALGIARLRTDVDDKNQRIRQVVELKTAFSDWVGKVGLTDENRFEPKKLKPAPQTHLTFR